METRSDQSVNDFTPRPEINPPSSILSEEIEYLKSKLTHKDKIL